MLLTISTTYNPATDLGYLLHKNPARVQSFELAFGTAQVFYPQADENVCTCALLLDIDTVGLVRKRDGQSLEQYVNDRAYVASSFLSVALAQVFREALAGRSKERSELVDVALPLKVRLSTVPSRGGGELLRRLFEPLGYRVQIERLPLDEQFPGWGESSYFSLDLEATLRLSELMTHLYVLIPVLDDDKHYWVGEAEVEKLLKRGEGWLTTHPERELIVNRYLRRRRALTRQAFEQLVENEATEEDEVSNDQAEEAMEKPISLHEQRLQVVLAELKSSGAKRVLDLGCGEGRLLRLLLKEKQFESIVGMDVSHRVLETARDKLRLERMPPLQQARISLMQGSLTYRYARLNDYDAAAVVEVIEHLDKGRLAAFERVLWEFARPRVIVLTTPNREYNVKWETLPAGQMRHKDHRFEWTRAEFAQWAEGVAERFGYSVRLEPIGPVDDEVGAPSQMGVFTVKEKADDNTTIDS